MHPITQALLKTTSDQPEERFRLIAEARATAGFEVSDFDDGKIVRVYNKSDYGGITFLILEDKVVDPEGKPKRWALRVPAYTLAQQAVAWTFGLNQPDYQPVVET